ncbi:unnamed protein product, partial [Didymodactylos carnosus]
GTIPPNESLSSPLSLDIRIEIESHYHLPPNPSRAEELRKIVNDYGFHHISTRIWPSLKCAICIISHTVKQFELKLLSTYWNPQTPIYPYAYGMSEHHHLAIPLNTNSYQLVPLPRSVYYEFIEAKDDDEEDDDDDHQPESFELDQIEGNKGKRYEVVLTTYDGLYRYRTEDIVEVTGHYYTLPIWELIGRFATEHVTEMELCDVIDSILSEYKDEFTSSPQYSVFIDNNSSHYVLAIEVDSDKEDKLKQIGKEICSKFDQKLQESNEEYKKCRSKKKISSPILLWLKNNTLTTGVREYLLNNKGGSKIQKSNQIKSTVVITNRSKNIIKFLKENKVLKIEL